MLAEPAQEQIAPMRDFQSRGMAVHVLEILRNGLREMGEIGLIHRAENDQMSPRNLHGVFDHFRDGRRLGEVGDPYDQAAAVLFREQGARCAGVVGFRSFSPNLRETIDDCAQMNRAASRGDTLLDGPAIGDQADFVTALGSDLGQRERGIDGVVELG